MEIEEFIWTPEDYDPSNFHINDLIILKLKTPFVFNKVVRPVELPYDKDFGSNEGIDKCLVTGWGALETSKSLHKHHVKLNCIASPQLIH